MPAVAVVGSLCTGHNGYPPRKAIQGDPTITINGKPIHRLGDAWEPHSDGTHSHDGISITAIGNITANGIPICVVGDSISCGSKIATGADGVTT